MYWKFASLIESSTNYFVLLIVSWSLSTYSSICFILVVKYLFGLFSLSFVYYICGIMIWNSCGGSVHLWVNCVIRVCYILLWPLIAISFGFFLISISSSWHTCWVHVLNHLSLFITCCHLTSWWYSIEVKLQSLQWLAIVNCFHYKFYFIFEPSLIKIYNTID